MRVLQLIDSLEAGGAERVALNFANALAKEIEGSFLCATRAEGVLVKSIDNTVGYIYINKKSTLDIKAIIILNRFIKFNKIDLIHAHSTSYFLATIIKFLNPKLKLVWHDHYGESEFLDNRPRHILQICSLFFSHVFVVNSKLKAWAKKHLKVKSISYLANYAMLRTIPSETKLKGQYGKRVVCMANLRPQKDHLNLLKAFSKVIKKHPDWTLHLIGKNFNDNYSKTIFKFIKSENLEKHIFTYGSCPDTSTILKQCNVGLLSSKSEGLPLALLEYGLLGLPVIATNVGQCDEVIKDSYNGVLVSPNNVDELSKAILLYIEDEVLRHDFAVRFNKYIKTKYSKEVVINKVIETYKNIMV